MLRAQISPFGSASDAYPATGLPIRRISRVAPAPLPLPVDASTGNAKCDQTRVITRGRRCCLSQPSTVA
jgi:hypothetical protein